MTAYHLRTSISTADLSENRGLASPVWTAISKSAKHYNQLLEPWLPVVEVSLARVKVFKKFGRFESNLPPKAPIPAGDERIDGGRPLRWDSVPGHPLPEDR